MHPPENLRPKVAGNLQPSGCGEFATLCDARAAVNLIAVAEATENLQRITLRRIRGNIGLWRICLTPSGGEFRIYDLGANPPLSGSFSKFTSDDSREFPATGVVANSPAD